MAASEWEQAGAACDRIWDGWADAEICSRREEDGSVRVKVRNTPFVIVSELEGHGPTYVAALIDLGRQWAQDAPASPETHETDGHDG